MSIFIGFYHLGGGEGKFLIGAKIYMYLVYLSADIICFEEQAVF